VIQLLANPSLASLPAAAPAAASKPPAAPKAPKSSGEGGLLANKAVLIGGGVGALALIGIVATVLMSGSDPAETEEVAGSEAAAPAGDPSSLARQAVAAGLPGVPCTWLDLVDAQANGTSVALSFRGVAGRPAEAQGAIGKLLTAKGLQAGSIDFSDVSPINPGDCGPLEAFRQIRAPAASKLSVAQRQFEMVKLGPEFGPDAGKLAAPAVIQVNTNADSKDMSLVGMDDSGAMTKLIGARSELSPANGIEQPQPGVYRFQLNTDHMGWSGILLLSGQGPFDDGLLNGTTASRGADWANKFLAQARQKGWQAEMVWYRTVDAAPN
jgi:serine/threonine-protein kinase